MNTARQHWPLLLAAAFALGGCVAVPVYDDDYGYRSYRGHGYYTEETIILSPPPRVEYRGYAPGHLWIDGYWSRTGTGQHWVPGYWAAPGVHVHPRARRAPPRHQAEQGHERRQRGDNFHEPRRRQDRAWEPAHDRPTRRRAGENDGRDAAEADRPPPPERHERPRRRPAEP